MSTYGRDQFGQYLLVNVVVLGALVVVAPMALGGRRRWWASAAASVAVGMCVPPGWAVVFAFPLAVPLVGAAWRARWGPITEVVSVLWAGAAAGALAASLAGLQLFGIGEPIVRLTAVHYLYAGVGALVIAGRLRGLGTTPRLAAVAVGATAAAPPVVALGFVVRHPLPQVGGAVLMTVGVWAAAIALLAQARRWTGTRRTAAVLAGLATWVPMVLAVLWAASNYWLDVPALPVPVMARTHGVVNAVGFVVAGLWATAPRRSVGRRDSVCVPSPDRTPEPADGAAGRARVAA